MKSIISTVWLAFFTSMAVAQEVADPDTNAAPSMAHYYYENLGQLIDDSGQQRSDIRYYTENATPSIYLGEEGVSFVAYKPAMDSSASDTTFRIDMQFICNQDNPDLLCGSLETYDQSHDFLNFYLPQCPSGITNIYGYAGVKYRNAFPQTDIHFYSDQLGFKSYINFQPGAVPTKFLLGFTGQDSITLVASLIELHLAGAGLPLAVTEAYNVDPLTNTITVLPWLPIWVDSGNGRVALVPGGLYNQTESLVYKISRPVAPKITGSNGNMDWCTFYGGSKAEHSPSIISNAKNDLYHVMAQTGGVFPYYKGTSSASLISANKGRADCYLSKFDSNQVRVWATYFGGSNIDIPYSIANTESLVHGQIANLFISGETNSMNLPLGSVPANFKKTKFGGGAADGFISGFNNTNGQLQYTTYFGGSAGATNARDVVTAMTLDANLNLYFCGNTYANAWDSSSNNPDSAKFPLRRSNANQYFQIKTGGAGYCDGFIGKLYLIGGQLLWSTCLGGEYDDKLLHIIQSSVTGSSDIYVVGETRSPDSGGPYTSPTNRSPVSGKLPLSDPSTSSVYFQNSTYNNGTTDGLIAHFNASEKLDWCTFFGGKGYESFSEAAINSTGDLYIIGSYREYNVSPSYADSTNSSIANNSYKLPLYHDVSSYWQYPING